MIRSLAVLVVSFILTLAISIPSGAIGEPTSWQKHQVLVVHHCEEPVWNVNGPQYFGGLGWLSATWLMFRLPWMPMNMAYATVREQSLAMVRFATRYGWPDLGGVCRGY